MHVLCHRDRQPFLSEIRNGTPSLIPAWNELHHNLEHREDNRVRAEFQGCVWNLGVADRRVGDHDAKRQILRLRGQLPAEETVAGINEVLQDAVRLVAVSEVTKGLNHAQVA